MKNKKAKNDEFYVEIEDSVELRRQMLETSKELVGILQQYDEMKNIDAQKVQEIEHFRATLKEIGMDIARLKEMMPKVKLSDLPKKEHAVRVIRHHHQSKPAPVPVVETPEPQPEQHAEEPNKLDSELQEIEDRLQHLE